MSFFDDLKRGAGVVLSSLRRLWDKIKGVSMFFSGGSGSRMGGASASVPRGSGVIGSGSINGPSASGIGSSIPPGLLPVDRTRELIEEELRIGFVTSTDKQSGKKWAPLKWRVGMPLILTGLLMSKVLQSAREATIDKNGVFLLLTEPFYAKFHQFGTTRIPPRPFYGISDNLRHRIAKEYGHKIIRFLIDG